MKPSVKPPALRSGSRIKIVSPASPPDEVRLYRGCQELVALGYAVQGQTSELAPDGYFAATKQERRFVMVEALQSEQFDGAICARGGYGSNYLLDTVSPMLFKKPRILCGYSDVTSLQIFLWQTHGWITLYGPMVAAGFDAGAGQPEGYDRDSFHRAVTETRTGWSLDLQGEMLAEGESEGVLLGGCLTMVQTTLGTPWELDTRGSILLLEDRGMKPYQVDRALMHLEQAGKFKEVRGMILGEFPECEPSERGDVTVRDVLERIIGGKEIPIVFGAPVGHTPRPMLTLPLGVRARLHSMGAGRLEILEPACSEPSPSA